jgi:hypothetical protein
MLRRTKVAAQEQRNTTMHSLNLSDRVNPWAFGFLAALAVLTPLGAFLRLAHGL